MAVISKIKTGIAAGLVALAGLLPYQARAAEYSLFCDGGVNLGYESQVVSRINNIPSEIRDLPVHPDEKNDSYTVPPIEKDSVALPGRISLADCRAGIEISTSEEELKLRAGAGINFNIDGERFMPYSQRSSAGVRSIEDKIPVSQLNAKRLEGCSSADYNPAPKPAPKPAPIRDDYLDYYRIMPVSEPFGGDLFKPYLFLELSLSKELTGAECDITYGLKLSQQKMDIESGWTRNNIDLVCRREELASLIVLSPYISMKEEFEYDEIGSLINFIEFDAGLSFAVQKEFTELGKKTNFEFSKFPFSIGMRIGRRF